MAPINTPEEIETEAQEQRVIGRLITEHPKAVYAVGAALIFLGLLLGSLFGKDAVRGIARGALRMTGVPVQAEAAAPEAAAATMQAAIREEMQRQFVLYRAEEREWTREQLTRVEERLNSRLDNSMRLAAARSRSLATTAPTN